MDLFVDALAQEMASLPKQFSPTSIFFGGGTPSLLNLQQWDKILQSMAGLNIAEGTEWTIECNPATVSSDKASLLKSGGVNRISMGVQSMDEGLLERLGRIHSRQAVYSSYEKLRRAGFENINLDLMFAIPTQTLSQWKQTLREIITLQPEHLSSYEVIYEDDTPLFHQLKAGEFEVDDDLSDAMYEHLLSEAASAGYERYEIANFAKAKSASSSYACQHNLNYWQGGDWIGLGPSASSRLNGIHWRNIDNTTVYRQNIAAGVPVKQPAEILSPKRRASEVAAFGLRMTRGWSFDLFLQKTGWDLREHWQEAMQKLIQEDKAIMTEERFYLTSKGLKFADYAASLFVE